MRQKLISCFGILSAFLFCTSTFSQNKTITGKVLDSLGAPIPGVSVRLKASKAGTTTMGDGGFHIVAKPTDILMISNVGFEGREIPVSGRENIEVILTRNSEALNEVVVTALGIRRSKNSLPYATQQIAGTEIRKTLNTNFVDNLAGKVAGLQITASNTMGGSNNVILRGMKSLTTSNQALFVVDGVPYDNSNKAVNAYDLGNTASDINPEDIESVSVLKGASASALYGSRGYNGVILITTKKRSRRNKGIGVTVDFGITTGRPDKSTLPKYQEEYGQGNGSAGSGTAGNPNSFFYYQPVFNSAGVPVLIVQTNADQVTGPAYDPNLMVYNWDAFSPGNPNYGKATPWMPASHNHVTDYFETPVTTSTSVYADGGSDRATFKMGYTHSYDKSYLPNSNLGKNQLTFGTTYNLTDKVTLGGQINYSDVSATGRSGFGYSGSNGTGVNPMTEFRQWWQTNVDVTAQKADYFRTQMNATWNWQGGYLTNSAGNLVKPAYHDNLYWQRYENYEKDNRTRYLGNVNINYKVTSYLNIMARVSKDNYNELLETRYNVGSAGTPSYTKNISGFSETNYDLLLNFDKDLGEKLNLKALLGGNVRRNLITSNNAVTNGGLVVPGFYALANSVNTPNAPTETLQRKEVDGVFAGFTLSYFDMITLDGTIRRDQSSTLPANNNSYYYPAISANFVFTKLLPVSTWLTYGKLRANYAGVGNDAPFASLQNTYTSQTPFNGQTVFSSPTTNNNKDLIPERNQTYEFGLEMSFLKGRVGFDVTYYDAKSIDQIMPVTVSSASGYATFYVNGGTVQNKGVELTLNLVPVRTTSFNWNIAVNWSTNHNKVLSLYNDQPSYTIARWQNSVQLVAEVGKPYGIIRGSDYVYVNGQKEVDAKGNYIKSANKLSDIGSINPDWMGGINNSFTYKNFTFSFLIDMKKGGQIYSLDMDYGASSGITPETAGKNDLGNPVRSPLANGGGVLFPGVTADGKQNTVRVAASDINTGAFPFSSLFSQAASSFVYDASYIKLREIALSWSFPQKAIEKLKYIKGLDLSLTGRNLWLIHKNLPYSDPEQGIAVSSTNGQNGSMGFQSGAYPVFKTFGFNVKVKF